VEGKGEKAVLYTVYSCSICIKLLLGWHKCFTPHEKAKDTLVWPCKQGQSGVETQLSSDRAQASLLLEADEEMRELSQAVPEMVKWLYKHMSEQQIMLVLKVVANDAKG